MNGLLEDFSRNKKAYDKQTVQEVDVTTSEYIAIFKAVNSNDQTNFNANSRGHFNIGARGTNQTRGRGRRSFVRQTGETDPYDMSIAL